MAAAIARGNATTGAITFPFAAACGGLGLIIRGSRKVNVMSGGKFWTKREESAPAEGVPAATWLLTTVDRCDRCGAQAYVRVLLPGGRELLFCAHHNRQHASALAKVAVEIQDETRRLAPIAA
jgi:hypothetical protein